MVGELKTLVWVDLVDAAREDPFIHIYSADKDDYVKISYSEANRAALNGSKSDRGVELRALKEELNEIHAMFEEIGKKKVAAAKTPRRRKKWLRVRGCTD